MLDKNHIAEDRGDRFSTKTAYYTGAVSPGPCSIDLVAVTDHDEAGPVERMPVLGRSEQL
jgi:hypothetical protein